jgi:hypothetical protein
VVSAAEPEVVRVQVQVQVPVLVRVRVRVPVPVVEPRVVVQCPSRLCCHPRHRRNLPRRSRQKQGWKGPKIVYCICS